jgi:hypothetical protein
VSNQAILYLSHVVNTTQWRAYKALERECAGMADVYYVSNLATESVPHELKDTFPITPANRKALGHPSRDGDLGWWMDTSPSHTRDIKSGFDQALLSFRQLKPEYDYYWILEYDVEFSGRWSEFFSAFSGNTSDLICSSAYRYETNPAWDWWRSVKWPGDTRPDLVHGFFPLARLSGQAIDAIIEAGRSGVDGFYEAIWPTVVNHRGMSIEDFGGDGEFVRASNVNRWYTSTLANHTLAPGSFVARPIRFRPGWKPNQLWHPVKRRFVRHIVSRLKARMSPSWWMQSSVRPARSAALPMSSGSEEPSSTA